MGDTIRILIADDHTLVREGLRALINQEPDMEVIGEATSGAEVVEKARSTVPDVIILDLVMADDGSVAIGEIKRSNPDARILVLTGYGEDEKVLSALQAGALGFLTKDQPARDVIHAVRCMVSGQSCLHSSIANRLLRRISEPAKPYPVEHPPLTKREMDVLSFVAKGLSNQEIGRELSISERTVRAHISNILGKLGLANRTQAALHALREGLVHLESEGTSEQ